MSKMVNIRCLTRRKANALVAQVNKAEAELEAAVKIAKAEHEYAAATLESYNNIHDLWRATGRRHDAAEAALKSRTTTAISLALIASILSLVVIILVLSVLLCCY